MSCVAYSQPHVKLQFVNDQKFACESCIKGHRSSSCQHTDRPLFEIKKKGRPVSQCGKCRELRKTKRMHNKCNCASGSLAETPAQIPQVAASSSSKSRRFKPIAPALPNGLKSLPSELSQSASIAGSSFNASTSSSCGCGAPGCRCLQAAMHPSGADTSPHLGQRSANGLTALAAAAAICWTHEHPVVNNETGSAQMTAISSDNAPRHGQPEHCGTFASDQPPNYLPHRPSPEHYPPQRKRRRSGCAEAASTRSAHLHTFDERDLQLPPIRYPGMSHSESTSLPVFPPIPPLSEIASLAGSGCCCGVECTCPGCVQHRGPVHASEDFPDCEDGCGTCVDNESGVGLPSPGAGSSSSSAKLGPGTQPNFIDAFFARAASLPLPPATRMAGLDAMNVTVYPSTLFSGGVREREERRAAFGLVSIPPLECGCAGGCGCPAGRCGCGDGCAGCC
ncbi:uncharacterized protein C8Q71DRAFT_59632 [Rhodofomes roseus]|uniref:Copper-fist domain-containing protein n=1 Tax=Rhodofomes roseus TaxID=34475 RepID=A0ABQ8KH86_9APHY|nr:uncharacterized protein C8Q71DRAFT_59632 [Rhodofomes roseus]KAH9836792.1 hypothetical protein C8Q71DRAFT_59632 [Rhodofomes roseus]